MSATVDIAQFAPDDGDDAEHDLRQIRRLFVDGMAINDAPAEYIRASLESDLKDARSMRATYLSGRGTFLLLSERDDSSESSSNDCGGDGGRRRRVIGGIVGLQDVSSTTGTGQKGAPTEAQGGTNTYNLCELRRMSIHAAARRRGHGTRLVRECIAHARRQNFDGIKLYTGGWMATAISFYVEMGFEDRGRLEYPHNDGTVSTIAHLEMIF